MCWQSWYIFLSCGLKYMCLWDYNLISYACTVSQMWLNDYIEYIRSIQEPPTQGTVKPHSPFDAETDAKKLRNAMKGFGKSNVNSRRSLQLCPWNLKTKTNKLKKNSKWSYLHSGSFMNMYEIVYTLIHEHECVCMYI